jgi:hypothetical protein
VNWQVKYALKNLNEPRPLSVSRMMGELIRGDLIRIVTENQPDVFAAVSEATNIDAAVAIGYREAYPEIDFLCGYRPNCIWHGDAIEYLWNTKVGWGTFGTMTSAALEGDAKRASHKTYRFSDRLLRQTGGFQVVFREFDRVYQVARRDGSRIRIAMLAEYEPTANDVRTLWAEFGPFDIAWNINPNGSPSPESTSAALELGCEVMKWDELKVRLRNNR